MQKPSLCDGCILRERGFGFSTPDGDGTLGVMGIGPHIGHDEAIDGLPFRPRAASGASLRSVSSWRMKPCYSLRSRLPYWEGISSDGSMLLPVNPPEMNWTGCIMRNKQ